MKPFLIFLVDDDPIFLKVLETQFIEQTSYIVSTFLSGEDCLEHMGQKPDMIFLDYYLSTTNSDIRNGLEVLDAIKATSPRTEVVMLSSQDSVDVAVNCMKHHAFDYIIKGEATFVRAQNAITTLFKNKKLENEVVFYRTSAIALEKMVEERTHEVVEQRILVETKHKEITDSIKYAEQIQRSFLPSAKLLEENFRDHFVYYQPKDVVSGDFYWANKLSNNHFALLTADSTGHGVPGALMSILNISCVEKAIEGEKLTQPNEILNHTREKIIETLKRGGSEESCRDGMDCSLIAFDFENSKLTYSAANNPIWIARNMPDGKEGRELLVFASDKMPVGKHHKDFIQFSQHTVDLQKGDVVYAITDGLSDQFGGPKGKKFMSKQLKGLLISISHLPMLVQKEMLGHSFSNWKGELDQVDDITIIGVRV